MCCGQARLCVEHIYPEPCHHTAVFYAVYLALRKKSFCISHSIDVFHGNVTKDSSRQETATSNKTLRPVNSIIVITIMCILVVSIFHIQVIGVLILIALTRHCGRYCIFKGYLILLITFGDGINLVA